MTQTEKLSKFIDHTLLKTQVGLDEIIKLVNEAKEHDFHSVCVRPEWIKEFASQYRCSAVIAFPDETIHCNSLRDLEKATQTMGDEEFDLKILEFNKALEDGAIELDPVMPIALLNTEDIQDQDKLKEELEEYFKQARTFELKNFDKLIATNKKYGDDFTLWIKPIFSCECLDDEELELSVSIFAETVLEFKDANPDSKIRFSYKNSTGFIKGLEDMDLSKCCDHEDHLHLEFKPQACLANAQLISKIANFLSLFDPEKIISIKAAGGIRSNESAQKIIKAADGRLSHIGTSVPLGPGPL